MKLRIKIILTKLENDIKKNFKEDNEIKLTTVRQSENGKNSKFLLTKFLFIQWYNNL